MQVKISDNRQYGRFQVTIEHNGRGVRIGELLFTNEYILALCENEGWNIDDVRKTLSEFRPFKDI